MQLTNKKKGGGAKFAWRPQITSKIAIGAGPLIPLNSNSDPVKLLLINNKRTLIRLIF